MTVITIVIRHVIYYFVSVIVAVFSCIGSHNNNNNITLIQHFNAVAVLGTFAPTTPEEEV